MSTARETPSPYPVAGGIVDRVHTSIKTGNLAFCKTLVSNQAEEAPMNSVWFYSDLPVNTISVSQLIGDETRFFAPPEDWCVILTDVRNSTHALSDGKHHLVNLIAVGSIIAALNIAHRAGVSLPFFFGGDGATLFAPAALSGQILQALAVHGQNARENFDLDLRVGHVPLTDVYRHERRLKIAKVDINQGLVIPIVLGEGLDYVENVVKNDGYPKPKAPANGTLDLKGMECRWNNIRPPENAQEVVCLILNACAGQRQAAIFSTVLHQIDAIYGPLAARNPISLPQLKLNATMGKIKTEMRARLGRFDFRYLVANWLITRVGGLYFAHTKEGANYLNHVVHWSDILTIDGRISTIMSGTEDQRIRLVESLRRLEESGEIRFGIRVCTSSVMSCYVHNRVDQHIHFVDGLGGGYTQAATMLKKKKI